MFKTAIDRHTDAYDIDCQRLLPNLDEVQTRSRAINQRLLDTERVGQGTILASPAFERILSPHGPPELRAALRTIDNAIDQRLAHTRICPAA